MRLFGTIIGIVLFVFLFMMIGGIVLEEFPQLQPLWEEFVFHVKNIYNYSLVKWGALSTILLILGIFVVLGSSKKI